MKKIRILQIEDDEEYAEILKDILSEYDITLVNNRRDAIKILKEDNDFDVIICDNKLPNGVLGTILIPEIKKICNIPIIANSSLNLYCDDMVEAGASDYMVKDYHNGMIDEWKDMIESLIHIN